MFISILGSPIQKCLGSSLNPVGFAAITEVSSTDLPANAVYYNGEPVYYDGEVVTYEV